jgi:hypothetical protein
VTSAAVCGKNGQATNNATFSLSTNWRRVMSKLLFATNELKDAVLSLQMVNDCLAKVKEDNLYWKWVLIALHNALQGFMVTCLCPMNPYPVMQEARRKCRTCPKCKEQFFLDEQEKWGSREEWEAWKGDRKKQPKPPWLLPFMDMYERIKKPAYMEHWGGKAFKPKGTQGASVKRLNLELRNDFIHFMPKNKLALVQEFLPVLKDVTGIISFLALDSDSIAWVEREGLYSKTKDLVTSISAKTGELERIYAAASKEKRQPDPEVEAWIAAVLKRIESPTEE